jgi:chemotaxis protein MotB
MPDFSRLPPASSPRSPSRVPLVVLVVALLGVGAGGIALIRQHVKANALAEDAGQQLKAAQTKIAALETQRAQLEAEKEELEAAKLELSRSVQVKEGELVELKGTYDQIQDKLKAEIAHGDIRLEQTGGKLRVALVDKVLFDSGEAQISKRGEEVLARVAEILAGLPDQQIQVSGHTDRTPITSKLVAQFPTNWELSVARATNVVRFLAEKANVPPQRLVASGYGEYKPVASNKTASGRARNRRIEILLTPMLAPKAVAKSKLVAAAANSEGKVAAKTDDKAKTAGKKPKTAKTHARKKH